MFEVLDEFIAQYKNSPVPVAFCDDKLSLSWANAATLEQYPFLKISSGFKAFLAAVDLPKLKESLADAQTVNLGMPASFPSAALFFVPAFKDDVLIGSMVFFNQSGGIYHKKETAKKLINSYSNQMRTPINELFGVLTMLERYDGFNGDPKPREYASAISGSAYKIYRALKINTDYARLLCGVTEIEKQRCDFFEFLKIICEKVKLALINSKIKFSFSVPNKPLIMSFDPKLITTAVMHVISNGVRAAGEGGKVSLKCSCTDSHVTIVITDDGIGIRHEDADQIFEPYFSAWVDNSFLSETLGLGLAVVKKNIDLHKGTVAFDLHVDKGAKVIMTLAIEDDTSCPDLLEDYLRQSFTDSFSDEYVYLCDTIDPPGYLTYLTK